MIALEPHLRSLPVALDADHPVLRLRHGAVELGGVAHGLAIERVDDVAGAEADARGDAAAIERLDEDAGLERIEAGRFGGRGRQRDHARAGERMTAGEFARFGRAARRRFGVGGERRCRGRRGSTLSGTRAPGRCVAN